MVRSSRPSGKVATPVARRLAAIVAADVAGYSRLMGLDEAGTAQSLREHRAAVDPIVRRFGGRIVKTTGDGVLLEFPSVVAAVECAIGVQLVMAERNKNVPEDRRMQFRLGINLCDVLIEGHDILGDGVNVAARLEGIAEPGGICVSDDVYRHVAGKLTVSFEDMGDQQLKNIARPVHAYRVRSDRKADIARKPNTASAPETSLTLPDKPSIAVLPFDNMSGSMEDVYFADGIAEDIITELSRYPDLFVAARNSSFTYRGRAVLIADVARELGVRYVVEGSVRRGGNRIRIAAQLIDAVSGKHLWAQRYDRELQDVFAIQDDVTSSIVAVLPARIEAAATEAAARKNVESLEAYDYLLRGKYYHHLRDAKANVEAEISFDRAIELDPRLAAGYAWKACTLGQARIHGYRDPPPKLSEIARLVEVASRLDENDTECHRLMCRLALLDGRFANSEYHLERALEQNPNDPRLVVQRGINLTYLGDPVAAIPWIERAMRIDPFSAHHYYLDLVRALFMAGCVTQAIGVLERLEPDRFEHYVLLAACQSAIGDAVAAQEAGRRVLAMRPDFAIGSYLESWFAWKRPEDKARLRDALQKSHLPE
jgi:adenylate cyclase